MTRKLYATILLAALAAPALAQDMPSGRELDAMLGDSPSTSTAGHKTEAHKEAADTEPKPVVSSDGAWAGSLLIVIAAMFAAAMFIGPGLKDSMPSSMQPGEDAHGHGHDDHSGGGHVHDSHGHH